MQVSTRVTPYACLKRFRLIKPLTNAGKREPRFKA